jgi:hypothetical protein
MTERVGVEQKCCSLFDMARNNDREECSGTGIDLVALSALGP